MTHPNADTAREEAFLLDASVRVAAAVRKASRHDWGRELRLGADGTPTKVVDELAESIVLKALAESKLRLNVLSEEVGFVDNGADATLVMDPIDGTTNAYRGLPVYCVSLAIGRQRLSDVYLGVVHNIPSGDTYLVRRGGGAFLNGEPLHTRAFDPTDAILSPTLGKEANEAALGLAARRYNVRALGSAALEMCFVAQGALDLYYYASEKLRVTDIAASTLAVREAGGLVLNAAGRELDMDLSLTPRTSVVAAGSRETLSMLEVLRG